MKKNTIRINNREPAILTAELTYLGYQVENVLLEAGDFEGKTNFLNRIFIISPIQKSPQPLVQKQFLKRKKDRHQRIHMMTSRNLGGRDPL
ncbi:MAG: hypothetical protein ACFFB5_23210 [Promethearchaeota archaeon]